MEGKRVLWPLIGGLVLAACAGPHHDSKESSSSAPDTRAESSAEPADSLQTGADTLLMDQELADEPLPSTADEVFDDFLFLFDNSNRVQRQRVRFPLPVTDAEGQHRTISRHQWTHHSLSLGQDFCTVLWNRRRQMDMAEDASLRHASVEHIYLHSREVESFDFERDSLSGQWMLMRQRRVPFEEYVLTEFLDFYGRFATDSAYQRRHVQSPLRFSMTSEDSEENVEGTIDVDQWFEFAPDMPRAVLVNINYGQAFHDPNHVIMQMRGFSDSMQNLFTFHREPGRRWRLIRFEN